MRLTINSRLDRAGLAGQVGGQGDDAQHRIDGPAPAFDAVGASAGQHLVAA